MQQCTRYDFARTQWMSLQHGQNLHSKKVIKCCMYVLCMDKTLTDLQIWGCGLHQNAFGECWSTRTRWVASYINFIIRI